MADIIPPNAQQPVSSDAGIMLQVFRTWTRSVTTLINTLILLKGSGSPEGVVSAIQGRQYMDDAGVAGAILYIKRDAAITGDDTQGWILV